MAENRISTLSNVVGLLLILAAFGLLVPGIYFPVLTIKGSITLPLMGSLELGTETRSILGTVEYLYETKNYLVAGLIFLFSVVIPVLKGLLLLTTLIPALGSARFFILEVIRRIGKWSMADVFVVGIFLAFLASASMNVFKAKLEKGFYYFLGYCLISVLSGEFIVLTRKR